MRAQSNRDSWKMMGASFEHASDVIITRGGREAFLPDKLVHKYDAVVLGAGAAGLLYSTYFGGSGDDQGAGVAVDGAGSVYVAGKTKSTTNFPLRNPYQAALAGPSDGPCPEPRAPPAP